MTLKLLKNKNLKINTHKSLFIFLVIAVVLLILTVKKLRKNEFQDLGICKIYAYSSEKKQTDNTPEITSTGKKCRKGYAACSRDWFKKGIKYGDRIYIPDLNLYLEIQNNRVLITVPFSPG